MDKIDFGSKEFIEVNKKNILEVLSMVKREGIEGLVEFLENSSFFSDPASSKFHCNCPRRVSFSQL